MDRELANDPNFRAGLITGILIMTLETTIELIASTRNELPRLDQTRLEVIADLAKQLSTCAAHLAAATLDHEQQQKKK